MSSAIAIGDYSVQKVYGTQDTKIGSPEHKGEVIPYCPCKSVFNAEQCVDPFKESDTTDTVDNAASNDGQEQVHQHQVVFSWRKLWAFTGPGWLMSMAYIDPGNLEADLQAGAITKYRLLWVLFWGTAAGLLLQSLAVKLGVVSGFHLAQHCRQFPALIRYGLWIMIELALIGADLQELVGTATAINILSDGSIPLVVGCCIAAANCFVFMFLDSKGIRRLEMFFAAAIAVMLSAFGFQYFASVPPQSDVLRGLVTPTLSAKDDFETTTGLIGSIVMPHNLFLHSALVLTRTVCRDWDTQPVMSRQQVSEALYYNRLESAAALLSSFAINAFVICVFANLKYFDASGNALCVINKSSICPGLADDPSSCGGDIGLSTAGDCLQQINKESWWRTVWAVGVLASGKLALYLAPTQGNSL